MAFRIEVIREARQHLRRQDEVMRAIIDQVGPFTLRTERERFPMLVRSILSQQISLSAARSIRRRLEQLVAPAGISPESILRCDIDHLRRAGLSAQKASYLHDLAAKVANGSVRLATIGRLSDEGVIEQLTQVKGIGRWTAQMFLIFALGRHDVFPHDDLGVRVAIRDRYGLDELPSKSRSLEIAAAWRPFASIATWYCWRSLELNRKPPPSKENGYPT